MDIFKIIGIGFLTLIITIILSDMMRKTRFFLMLILIIAILLAISIFGTFFMDSDLLL